MLEKMRSSQAEPFDGDLIKFYLETVVNAWVLPIRISNHCGTVIFLDCSKTSCYMENNSFLGTIRCSYTKHKTCRNLESVVYKHELFCSYIFL